MAKEVIDLKQNRSLIIKDIARKINAKFMGVMAKKVIDLTTDGHTDGRTDRVIEVLRT